MRRFHFENNLVVEISPHWSTEWILKSPNLNSLTICQFTCPLSQLSSLSIAFLAEGLLNVQVESSVLVPRCWASTEGPVREVQYVDLLVALGHHQKEAFVVNANVWSMLIGNIWCPLNMEDTFLEWQWCIVSHSILHSRYGVINAPSNPWTPAPNSSIIRWEDVSSLF